MKAVSAVTRWSDTRALTVAFIWIPSVLWFDTWVNLAGQLVLGVVTWALLFWWLKHESTTVRVQTAVVVILATIIEYVFSGWLGVYVYRLDHVPAYVPPGHGLVYLAALVIGRLPSAGYRCSRRSRPYSSWVRSFFLAATCSRMKSSATSLKVRTC